MTTAQSSPPDPTRHALTSLVERAIALPELARREIVLARFLGKMAVDHGLRELRARLVPDDAPKETSTAGVAPHVVADDHRSDDAAMPDVADVPDVAALALSDYDHLSSAQVIAKLDGLDAEEREAIESYERASRHRRIILGKLEQLRQSNVRS